MRLSLVLRATNNQNLENLKKIMNQAIAEAPQYLEKLKSDPKKLDTLKNVMKQAVAEAPQYLERLKQDQRKIVYEKIEHLNKWYTKVIGLDEVKVYQERVAALQDQLLTTQNKRREINRQLTEVRQQAQEIQSQIQHIDRKEKFDIYCQLINEEREILNLERSVTATFQEYDQAERDLFAAFTNAIRDSQEKQKTQLEYSKYIFLILSMIGSCLAFLYTFFWRQDLKSHIDEKISSLKVDHFGRSISEAVHTHMAEIKKIESANQKEIMQNRKVLQIVVDHVNSNQQKPLEMSLSDNEESDAVMNTVIKWVGIGIIGYSIGKVIIG